MIQNEAQEIAKKTNFLNKNITCLKNVSIREYDIRSAGFSVLKFKHLISDEKIKEWEALPKHERTVAEGLLQRDNPEIAKEIVDTLSKVRQAFVLLNKIRPQEILAIKKDAIFLINKKAEKTVIKDIFEFREKGNYTSYLNLNGKEFYYNSLKNILDIKGISEEAKKVSEDFFLKDIKRFISSFEKLDMESLYTVLNTYRTKYIQRELPKESYRELSTGMFRFGKYLLKEIDDSMLEKIDISQNYVEFLLPLFQALL